jgi:Ca2+-binding RTX toxin-like protein
MGGTEMTVIVKTTVNTHNAGVYYANYFGTGDPIVVDSFGSTSLVYHNPDNPGGFASSVSVHGTGFSWDGTPDGTPAHQGINGIIKSVTVTGPSGTLLTITGLHVAMSEFYSFVAGWNDGLGDNHQGYNGFDILTSLTNHGVKYIGTSGDDDLVAGASPGNDLAIGGNGNDFFNASRGDDTYIGGGGRDDIVNYAQSIHDAQASQGVHVDLASGIATDPWGGHDHLSGIEEVWGSNFNDVLLGDAANNYFEGMRGNDSINGGGGNGNAVLYQHDVEFGGNRGIHANLRTGRITDGFGTVDHVKNIQGVIGTEFADVMIGDKHNNFFEGGPGADFIDGGGGNNTIQFFHNGHWKFGGGGVTVDLGAGIVANDGFGTTDTIVRIQNVQGSDFADVITGDGAANGLFGNGGNDKLDGKGGNDFLQGGPGADQFIFSTTPNSVTNHDTVDDFSGHGGQGDTIRLSKAVFSVLTGNPGDTLTASDFHLGSSATSPTDHIIYDQAHGNLFYDPTGNTVSHDQVLIAHFNGHPGHPAIDNTDILLI